MDKPRAKFRLSGSTPPIGYVYEEELEGRTYRFQASMQAEILRQLRLWYQDKKLEWPGETEMIARIEDYICQLVPKAFCKGGPDSPKVPFFSMGAIRDATRIFTAGLSRGEDILVPPEEADRRAKICMNCPNNLHGICTSCAGNEFIGLFRMFLTRGRKTKYDSYLDVCNVCGCLLKAKVHVKLEELSKLQKRTYPENCWLHGTEAHVDE